MALHNRLKDHLTKFCIFWLVAVLWVSIVIVSMTWNLHHIKSDFIELARLNAETILKRDLLYRQWAALHGGIYVPVTERTPPNPYLTHIPDRDINGPEGKTLGTYPLGNFLESCRTEIETKGKRDVPAHD